jgi:DNA-binding CsgD family transcriptional regulator
VERAYASGPVSQANVQALNAIRPHLARSALIAARLAFERMRTGIEVLDRLGLAAFALAANGRVLMGNENFELEKALWTTRFGDKIALLDSRADRMIYETLSVIDSNTGIRSIPLFSLDGTGRAVLHVVPIRRSARDIFNKTAAIAVLTKSNTKQSNAAPLLQALFDLTPAEAAIAALLAVGQTARFIAMSENKSFITVRNQINGVLQKTGCHRQSELLLLLTRLNPASL